MNSDENDRVRRHTSPRVNQRLDEAAASRVQALASAPPGAIAAHVRRLDEEWDVERVLEVNAAAIALGGVSLAAVRGERRWLAIPGVVLSFLMLHALSGWCPPLPVLRRAGVRTRREIERERTALKALRGDFGGVAQLAPGQADAARALRAFEAARV